MDQVLHHKPAAGDELHAIAKRIRSLDRSEIKAWLERGRLLHRAHELLGKSFNTWLRKNAIASRTAYKAIAAWLHFGDVPTSAKFSKEAMAILGQSQEARTAAITLSADGQRITARKARELVNAALCQNGNPTIAANERRRVEATPDTWTFETPTMTVYLVAHDGQEPSRSNVLSALLDAQRQLRERLAA